MPKTILEFNVPEENEELEAAQNGAKYKSVLQDLRNHLRGLIKHGELEGSVREALQSVRNELHHLLNDDDLHL
jgi:hypothetical protein